VRRQGRSRLCLENQESNLRLNIFFSAEGIARMLTSGIFAYRE